MTSHRIGLANPRKTSPVSAKIAALMKEIDRSRLKTKDSNSTTAQVHFSYLTQQVSLMSDVSLLSHAHHSRCSLRLAY